MTLLIAILTIAAPLLSVLAVAWAESLTAKKQNQANEEIDEYVLQHLKGDPAGLINLSRELERLQQQARRKRRDS